MLKRLVGLMLGMVFVTGLFYGQTAMACTTQTLIVGGKMTVCTVCGTVVSYMWSAYEIYLVTLGFLSLPIQAQVTLFNDSKGMPLGTANRIGNATY